jgi:hypothetical protein
MNSSLVDHLGPTVSQSFLRMGRSGSGSKFCGHFGVDEILDSGDLDVVPGAERENEYGLGVERSGVVVEPRLYMGGTNRQPLHNSRECP